MKDYTIAGNPTITPNVLRLALEHRHSPVQPEYLEIMQICLRWGVNPAVALGFFVNESSAGTAGAAVATLNWGNLREGPGQIREQGGFGYYASFLVSLNDWCKLLLGPLYAGEGLLTVSQVTPKYAPGSDNNDPIRYAAVVNFLCAEWEAMSQSGGTV